MKSSSQLLFIHHPCIAPSVVMFRRSKVPSGISFSQGWVSSSTDPIRPQPQRYKLSLHTIPFQGRSHRTFPCPRCVGALHSIDVSSYPGSDSSLMSSSTMSPSLNHIDHWLLLVECRRRLVISSCLPCAAGSSPSTGSHWSRNVLTMIRERASAIAFILALVNSSSHQSSLR